MHGRTAFRLTDGERRQLKQYVERGGMLLADSICASRAFSESFRREMSAIFSNCKLERIPVSDPLLSKTYGGSDLQTVSRLDPEATDPGKPLKAAIHKVAPDLEGIKFGDRWGVVFSPYDLSCAWRSKTPWSVAATLAKRRPHRAQRAIVFVAAVTQQKSIPKARRLADRHSPSPGNFVPSGKNRPRLATPQREEIISRNPTSRWLVSVDAPHWPVLTRPCDRQRFRRHQTVPLSNPGRTAPTRCQKKADQVAKRCKV